MISIKDKKDTRHTPNSYTRHDRHRSVTIPTFSHISALTVRLGRVLAITNDDVASFLGLVVKVVVDDALRATRVAVLCVERRARVVGNHAVATAERVLDRSPDVVAGCRLNIPDVTRVA